MRSAVLGNKKRIVIPLTFLAILLTVGLLYKAIPIRWSMHTHQAPGQLIDIGGYKLHIQCAGEGKPSVILDAGFACFSLVWSLVQPSIAQFTRVCSYDRAGLGWSERSPLSRTSAHMVKELHTLLETIQMPKPYILVGHSFGGVNMQLYANTYPDDVFGLVLVDSSHELILEKSKEFNRNYYHLLPSVQRHWHGLLNTYGFENVSNFTGIRAVYLKSLAKNGIATIPPTSKNVFLNRLLSPSGIYTRGQEAHHITQSHQQLAQSKNLFMNKPLIVISRGKAIDTTTDAKELWPYLTKVHEKVWLPLQKDLVKKSTLSKHVIAKKSGHTILWSEPEIIVAAVKELVDEYHADSVIEK